MLGKPHLLATYAVEGVPEHLGAKEWLTQMAKIGTWGDELAILALAEAYNIQPLGVPLTSMVSTPPTQVEPGGRTLGLNPLDGNHYDILSL